MHLLLNESHVTDVDTDLVVYLLRKGIDMNAKDIFQRVPVF